MHTKRHGHESSSSAAGNQRPWTTLILLALAQFMVILDITVVNVALPSIGEDLSFSPGDLQWVVSIYVLFTGGLLLLGGRAADLFGRRRVFLIGLAIFTAASLASGLAPSPTALIVSRAAQGLGAAMLTPGGLALITATYGGRQKTTALAVWGAIGGAGAAAGVVLGGLITAWLSWEWVFFINVPVGVLTGALVWRLVAADAPVAKGRRLDLPGALAAVAGLVTLVYAIQGAAEQGWGSARTLALIAAAAIVLAAFAAIERTVREPLVPPATWRLRSLVSGVGLMFGATGLLVGVFFLNSIYLQHVIGASALETGLAFLPLTVVIGLGSHLSSQLMERLGSRILAVAGLTLIGVGSALLAAAPDVAEYASDLLPACLVLGLGIGLVFPAAMVTTMDEVDHEGAGLASGLMTTGHELGAAFGVAVLSTVATATSTFSVGYGHGFAVAAVFAAVFAAAALIGAPSVRPTGEVRISAH